MSALAGLRGIEPLIFIAAVLIGVASVKALMALN